MARLICRLLSFWGWRGRDSFLRRRCLKTNRRPSRLRGKKFRRHRIPTRSKIAARSRIYCHLPASPDLKIALPEHPAETPHLKKKFHLGGDEPAKFLLKGTPCHPTSPAVPAFG